MESFGDKQTEIGLTEFSRVPAYTPLKEYSFRRLTRQNLEDLHEEIGLGRNQVRSAIAGGLAHGKLDEVPLPSEEQHGAKKTYITVKEDGK